MHKVIDGDTYSLLEYFEEKGAEAIADKYRSGGVYLDVSFDWDGDLILFRED